VRDIQISHLAFADDLIVFTNAFQNSINKVVNFLRKYETISDQLLNTQKTSFICSEKTSKTKIKQHVSFTGFQHKKQPLSYLECPISKGKRKIDATKVNSKYTSRPSNNVISKVSFPTRIDEKLAIKLI
jgi:hypothetical protein